MNRPATAPARGHGEDRGSTLVLVLLLIVIAGLIVVPLMTYAASVLRLNTAVSERSKDVEAAKAGLHVALSDPLRVFSVCDDGGTLDPVPLNGVTVDTTCQELEEIGPLDALGFEVPLGAVAVQSGAPVPTIAVGGWAQSPSVPPYPDASACSGAISAGCWWAPQLPVFPDEPWDAVDGRIWMPELPQIPSETRTPTPFDMPDVDFYTSDSGVRCKVFFPGYYPDEVVLGNDGGAPVYYYFASGVYYFEQPVTVREDADVVVGMGVENFSDAPRPEAERSFCASDYEMNQAIGAPALKEIAGGGATWVFGDGARLIVDDSAGSPSIRFNQRYAEEDAGGRISIMSVNGVANGADVEVHDVPDVNYVRESLMLETIDEENDVSTVASIDGTIYTPSNATYTDAARLPEAPSVTIDGRRHRRVGGGSDRAGVLAVWDELVDNAAGGALIEEFEVELRSRLGSGPWTSWIEVCDDDGDIVHLVGTGSGGGDQHACYIDDQPRFQYFEVRIRAKNAAGWGPRSTVVGTLAGFGSPDAVPTPPPNVVIESTENDDEARVSWEPSSSPDGVTITGYRAMIERQRSEAQPAEPPQVLGGEYVEVTGIDQTVRTIAAVDANGGPLTLEILSEPAGWQVEAIGGLDVRITPPLTGAPTSDLDETVVFATYQVRDAGGLVSVPASLSINWVFDPDIGVPNPRSFDARPEAGATLVIDLPVSEPQGQTVTLEPLALGALVAPDWDIRQTGPTQISILTNVTDGNVYTFSYNVTDEDGNAGITSAQVRITAPTAATTSVDAGSCEVTATPWFPTATWCTVSRVTDLAGSDTGFRARVEAITSIGDSAPGVSALRMTSFDGGGAPDPAGPLDRLVYPWSPEPIIDVRDADPNNTVTVRINGYVAVPMGRIRIDNPEADENDRVEIVGGVIAGTYDLVDPNDDDTIIGFFNDIVLQRKVRIVSTAGNITSTAVVQINEDSTYRVNSWVVN